MALTQTLEAGLKISNAPSDGKFLQYKDSTDKLTWAAATSVGGATGVDFNDGVEIRLGTSNDAVIDYDASNVLLLKTSTAGSNIRLDGKSYLDIYVDGVQKLLVSPTYGIQSAYDLTITGPDGSTGAKVVLSENNGLTDSKVTIQASNSTTENVQITLPTANPTSNGQTLTSTTAGVTSWADPAAGATGAGGDKIFWENGQTVTTDYTITNNYNAGTFGPVTINSGVTVTVGDGEYWTIM